MMKAEICLAMCYFYLISSLITIDTGERYQCTMNECKILTRSLKSVMMSRSNTMNGKRKGLSSLPCLYYLLLFFHVPVDLTSLCYSIGFFRMDEFMAGFHTISLKLKEMYQVCKLSRLKHPPVRQGCTCSHVVHGHSGQTSFGYNCSIASFCSYAPFLFIYLFFSCFHLVV